MNIGKDVRPLPMYEYKVLKHVPTFVRRRYDRDLDHKLSDATLDLSSEDGESRGDDGAEASNHAAVSDFDDEAEDELQADFNNEQDSQTYTDDMGMFSEDSKSESGGAEDEDIVYVGLDDVEDSRSEGNGTKDVSIVSDYVDDSVKDEVEDKDQGNSDNKQGFQSEDGKSIGDDGAEDSSPAAVINLDNLLVNNEAEDKQTYTEDFDSIQSTNGSKSESGGAKDADLTSNKDANVEDEIEGDGQAKLSDNEQDDSKSESKDVIDVNVEDKIEGIGDVKTDNEQGLCSEDGKKDDNAATDEYTLENFVDSSVKNEVQEREQDLSVIEDSKSEDNGTEDVNIISHNMDDSVQGEVEDKGLQISDGKQDMLVEDSKSEADATKDASADCYHMNDSAKDEVLDIEHDKKQDVSVEVQDKGVGSFSDEQDFSPKAFKETLERDGIDLCCPKCKNNITHTMIYRKKEASQQHQTTCYTFLTALFSCMHSMVVHWRTNYRSHFD
ncbi:dentin matrix acidic phosphoprotein 1-like isoform X2 [Chenopodium quinoa]|uniref:dentin matrix acidic phosphoprotein 1-like isoform X2 n=1 Tax=Chenopodium quinoa TaxID=63459 RepID=UPI000B790576|nr:dentin matrix acidic phosphoprotein 1-like isoform X2 [Chenopodium quinoa]